MRPRLHASNSREFRSGFVSWHGSLGARHRNVVLVLVVLAAITGGALLVLSPASVAGPQTASATCCSGSGSPSSAATQDTSSTTNLEPQATMPDPPGTIDGAKNPELIPDDVAYRVLLLAIAEPEDASPEQKARARAKIVRAQLSEDDEVLFLTMATQYKTQIDSLAAQAAQITNGIALVHPDSVQGRQLSQLGRQQDQVLVNTIAALKSRLSVGGSEKLDAHVQSIKRKMKLYPPPPNMPAF